MLSRPLLVALACVPVLALLWMLAFQTGAGARLDSRVFTGLVDLQSTPVEPFARAGANLAGPIPFALAAIALVTIALVRRRPWEALVVVIVLAGANLTTQVLKPLATVARPAEVPPAAPAGDAWPSGHTTAAVALALCLLLVAPARMRPWALAAGAVFAAAEGFGLVVMSWHYPSDVVAGAGVAVIWAALGLGALRAAAGRRAAERRPGAARPEAARASPI
jgi:membrane-associated phospholipid phosphatase